MKKIHDVGHLRENLQNRIDVFLEEGPNILVSARGGSLEDKIEKLSDFRSKFYEDLNQLQHEFLIIQSLEFLKCKPEFINISEWHWNPNAAGTAVEPDLRGLDKDKKEIISAEITTSKTPKGSIDDRMKTTLKNLDEMEGTRYYFVRTETMLKSANTKISNSSYDIKTIMLSSSSTS